MRSFGSLRNDLNKNALNFLRTDLDTAMTLMRIAGESEEGSEKRERNLRNARNAYDAVTRIRSRVGETTDVEREELDRKIAELRAALESFGEVFG